MADPTTKSDPAPAPIKITRAQAAELAKQQKQWQKLLRFLGCLLILAGLVFLIVKVSVNQTTTETDKGNMPAIASSSAVASSTAVVSAASKATVSESAPVEALTVALTATVPVTTIKETVTGPSQASDTIITTILALGTLCLLISAFWIRINKISFAGVELGLNPAQAYEVTKAASARLMRHPELQDFEPEVLKGAFEYAANPHTISSDANKPTRTDIRLFSGVDTDIAPTRPLDLANKAVAQAIADVVQKHHVETRKVAEGATGVEVQHPETNARQSATVVEQAAPATPDDDKK